MILGAGTGHRVIVLSFHVSQVGLGKTQRTVQQLLGAPGGRPLPTSAARPSSSNVGEPFPVDKGLEAVGYSFWN